MRDLLDETYLSDLCRHLAEEPPRGGGWITRARAWAAPPNGTVRGAWLRVVSEPVTLFRTAEEAGLPIPPDSRGADDPWLQVVQDNALAATLAVHAALAVTAPDGQAHRPGGPSIGTVLGDQRRRGGVHAISLDMTLELLARRNRNALMRVVALAQRARGSQVDLRTVAALAYSRPGTSGHQHLTANPTGHWPYALEQARSWSPADQVLRDALAVGQ
ncbi:hypothetical protein ACFRMQ_00185 [Kitasatospora sp. NPDC056783]|uniref:hypothetical protein n=1 Tax=Kitasatospora sp. NPDC056783 TaxID=3345943 RepID=UPI00369B1B7E